ncbi:MAG: hypothetical protein EU547_03580 [Promethearchaeota archaeon]|nr:MAG: hypothetical protein EU547_03580 [Candidatus Lokiarchaeota archaeon]
MKLEFNPFLKSFLFSLMAFIGINVIFRFIGFMIANSFEYLLENPFYIFVIICEGIGNNLYITIQGLILNINELAILIESGSYMFYSVAELYVRIGYLLAPIIAGILSGYFSETKIEAFGGFLLTFIVCWVLWTVVYCVSVFGFDLKMTAASDYETVANLLAPVSAEFIGAIFFTLLVAFINALTYSFFPLISKREYAI